MSTYEYTDFIGDKLRISSNGYGGATLVAEGKSSLRRKTILVEHEDVPTVAAELLKAAGQESVIVPKAAGLVEEFEDGSLRCGATDADSHAWVEGLRHRAAEMIAIAEHLESAAREAAEKAEAEAAEKKLQERRDALARRFTISGLPYDRVGNIAQAAINAYIELEDGASRD